MNQLLKQLQALIPLAKAATAGPWIAYPDAPGDNEDAGPFPLIGVATAPGVTYTADQYGQPVEHSNYGWDFICSTAHNPEACGDEEVANFESNADFIAAARNLLTPENLTALSAALAPQWVSVTERLPEENGVYLVFGNCTGKHDFPPTEDMARFYVEAATFSKYRQPTHWMPLPTPPALNA